MCSPVQECPGNRILLPAAPGMAEIDRPNQWSSLLSLTFSPKALHVGSRSSGSSQLLTPTTTRLQSFCGPSLGKCGLTQTQTQVLVPINPLQDDWPSELSCSYVPWA